MSGTRTNGNTIAKAPYAQRQVVVSRRDCAALGPVNAVQINGVLEKAKLKARFRSPDVSAMKTSRIR
jgi:hypothetical protein